VAPPPSLHGRRRVPAPLFGRSALALAPALGPSLQRWMPGFLQPAAPPGPHHHSQTHNPCPVPGTHTLLNRCAAPVAFFGYILNVMTSLLTASGPEAKRAEAVRQKLEVGARCGRTPGSGRCSAAQCATLLPHAALAPASAKPRPLCLLPASPPLEGWRGC
jgi:hypothetical protein